MVQFSAVCLNAALDAIETTTGAACRLRIFNHTSLPANCAAAFLGTEIANGILPSDWMVGATSGAKNLLGLWQVTGLGAAGGGTAATYFRIYDSANTTCHWQGTCGGQVVIPTSVLSAANSAVLTFASTAGVAVGMRVTGTGVPAGTRVAALTGTTTTLTHTLPTGVSSGATITFNHELTLDNATIGTGMLVTVQSFTLSSING